MATATMEEGWILFCAQEAGFQTRSMLIPYDLYIKDPERLAGLELLRNHAVDRTFEIRGKVYEIKNLLVQDIRWNGKMGRHVDHPATTGALTRYADGYRTCVSLDDDELYEHSIRNIASKGFNHYRNYTNFLQNPTHKYNIVESFLVVESNNGKPEKPQFDTVEEMNKTLYGF